MNFRSKIIQLARRGLSCGKLVLIKKLIANQ